MIMLRLRPYIWVRGIQKYSEIYDFSATNKLTSLDLEGLWSTNIIIWLKYRIMNLIFIFSLTVYLNQI